MRMDELRFRTNLQRLGATRLILAFCLLVIAPAVVRAEEPATDDNWPSFRNGNMLHGVADSTLPAELKLLWSYETNDGIPGTPAIYDGHVYCGILDGYVVCLEAKTGKEVWKYRSITDPDPKTFAPGFKAAPLVTDAAVFIGDEEGIFHCIDRKTGQQKWTFETFGEIVSSASLIDDRVIFGSYDNSLYCLKAENGEQLWKFETEGYVNCTPAIVNGFTFVTGCDEQLRVIDVQTGEQIKHMPLNTYLIASPAIMGDELYVGTYASEVIAVNWKQLTTQWAFRGSVGDFPYHSSAALTGELVVVGGRDKMVHAINRRNGEEVWSFPTRGKVDSSPVIVGERVFVGSDDGQLYELDLKSGKERWKYRLGRKVPGSPAVGSQILVIGSAETNGKLFAFGQ
ncbi:outer membrane protein assembly factor BamB family protein [Rubinisphaera margarita]|uniref:outer membrane protein assembly factor BamB family protein n=1 Tax=Rubinisphaera margarita TaxID=2909586 RepID=UPI001EE8713E|nr:PQQ-binding-like beta-propeller repeat protein [Rubinisphaera margarita]MCG6155335.1 PQQ-binding-like beta-propeller repeat protein [Rubinisphaera margarita]